MTNTRTELRKRVGRLSHELAPGREVSDELESLDEVAQRDSAAITIGIATFDDYDGAFFTIAALRLYHAEIMQRAEILLIDNHPTGVESASLRRLQDSVPGLRYVPVRSVASTAVRDLIFRLATGEVVVVLDSHVLLAPGALTAVAEHLADPGCRDLVQGPLLSHDGQNLIGTHWDTVWRAGMYGAWAVDARGTNVLAPAFDVPMQGLGVFACRRSAWPGLNPHFSGFGGEEGYLHEKFRSRGGRTMCLPALRWVHRFDRPHGIPYDLRWEHRVRNYVVGWSETGLPVDDVREHFTGFLGVGIGTFIDDLRQAMTHPLWRYDGIVVLNEDVRPGRWRRTAAALERVSLRPRRLAPITDGAGAPMPAASVAAAVRFGRHWGWSSFAVVGDAVLTDESDLDVTAERLAAGDHRLDGNLAQVAVRVGGEDIPGFLDPLFLREEVRHDLRS